ncbi:MAG: aldehyde ferredoxin oxidoreductase [Actinobacteria bacterium HGW-Actinobacteria-10]|nr:MAG: aldehyde ferredoxin oxidoreductase [Actinobacteria bacterium HGW-Actinobacteria-10]
MRHILRVNMSTQEVRKEPLPEQWKDHGGRLLTSAIVFTEVPADADPLGPDNKLVFAPGILGGTSAPDGGRLSVGAKSPLTGGIKESNVGGQLAHTLARLGYAGVIVEGKAPVGLWTLVLEADGSARLERTDEWAGLGNYALADAIKATRPADDRFATATIGPAGEKLLQAASIAVTDREGRPNRHAGRGGLGAVMASKGLKALIASDKGLAGLEHADKDAFVAAVRKFSTALHEHPVTGEGLPTYGTQILTNIINEAGGYPTRNFSAGSFEFAEALSGETMREVTLERGGNVKHACHTGCVIQCSRYWVDKDGHYKTKGMEYESVWSLGANCGIGDLDEVAELDRACGDIGVDTIEMGATLAVYMESGALEFGDAAGALEALLQVGTDSELGTVLGNGAEATGVKFGVTRIPVVKHQSMPAYDPRSIMGIGVTYATSTMGADHTAGYAITANILNVGGSVDPLSPEGQVALSQGLQIATGMLDALGMCIFVAFAVLDKPEALDAIAEMMSAHTGEEWDIDRLLLIGKQALTYERLFNEHAGFTAADDRLPGYMYTEKLPPHDAVFTVPDEELDTVYDFVAETAKDMGIS